MVWGVSSSRSVNQTLWLIHALRVGCVLGLPPLYRVGDSGIWFRRPYCWRTLLLDLLLFLAEVAKAVILACWLYVLTLGICFLTNDLLTPFADTNTIAYAVGVTSCDWACAVSLLAGASIGSDVTYAPTTAQTL